MKFKNGETKNFKVWQIVFMVLCGIGFVCSFTLFFPPIQNLILGFGERLIHRPFNYPDVWRIKITVWGVELCLLFVFVMTICILSFGNNKILLQAINHVGLNKINIPILICAMIFSFFVLFGISFEAKNDWSYVMYAKKMSFFQFILFSILFYKIIKWTFFKADNFDLYETHFLEQPKNKPAELLQKYFSFLEKYPIRTIITTFFVFNIPYIILSYPAIFIGDTDEQIIGLFVEGQKVTGHHPFAHTFFMGTFLSLHSLFGWNFCIFLAALTQSLFLWFVIGIVLKILTELKISKKIIFVFLLYYLIHPRISAYQFVMTKDVLYSAFLTLFVVTFYGFLTGKIKSRLDYAIFFLAIIGVVLFRNDGKYIVLIALFASLFLKGKRIVSLVCILLALTVNFGVNKTVNSLCEVEQGSIKEMLSVPFQQTARYVKYHGESVTDEEKDVISRILDYEKLAEAYTPDISDSIKGSSQANALIRDLCKDNLKDYFKVWFKMLLKHPNTYIQATMNNYYQYFFPGKTMMNYYSYSWGKDCMETTNGFFDFKFHFPQNLNIVRTAFEGIREDIFSLPFLSVLLIPAVYSWLAILIIFYAIYRKKWVCFLCCMPVIVQFLIFITGPTNGYYGRYQLPMFIYLPILTLLIINDCRQPLKNEGSRANLKNTK